MVVGIAMLIVTLLIAHDLEGAVGNHLVGIHVHRGTGTTLHHVDGEVIVVLAVDELAAGLRDGTCYLVVDDAEGVVGLNGS